jgi:hypothetical protein
LPAFENHQATLLRLAFGLAPRLPAREKSRKVETSAVARAAFEH